MAQKAEKQRTNWPARLRQAIVASGKSQAEIARQAGVTEAAVSRFVAGLRSLRLETAERIGRAVGVELTNADSRKVDT